MSLLFGGATSDRVSIAAAASINDLDPFTYLLWLYPTATTNARRIFQKALVGDTPGGYKFARLNGTGGTSGNIEFTIKRATTDATRITNDRPLNAGLNAWVFLACGFASSVPEMHVWTGSLTALATENTYGTTNNGAGAVTGDNASDLVAGNYVTANQAFPGRIAVFAVFNRLLTLAEIRSWQFRPRKIDGCVLFYELGFNGTATQPDWSGNGNAGTVTGATIAAHVPLGPPFGFDAGWFAGARTTRFAKIVAGTLTAAGALSRKTKKAMAGALSSAGALAKKTKKFLAAALATAGALLTQYIPAGGTTYFKSIAGTLAPAGALARKTKKILGEMIAQTDNFNRASLGPNWSFNVNSLVINASTTCRGGTAIAHNAGFYNVVGWPADQYSQVKIASLNDVVGAVCRAGAAGVDTFYVFLSGGVQTQIRKHLAGIETTLITGAPASVGDVLRLEVKGQTLTGYVNGVKRLTVSDSSIASGSAGLYFTGTNGLGDDWEGGSLRKILGLSGAVRTMAKKALGGTLAPAGALARRIRKNLAAALAPAGALAKKIRRALGGALSFTGSLVGAIVGLGIAVVTDVIIRPTLAAVARIRATLGATTKRTRPSATVEDVRRKQ